MNLTKNGFEKSSHNQKNSQIVKTKHGFGQYL